MRSVLIADIGATNCRFALAGEDGRPALMTKFRGDEVSSLEAALTRYLAEAGARPEAAVFAIAGPVAGDAVVMTNRAWSFRLSEVAKKFGWREIRGVNDFEAVAWSLLRLVPSDVRPLGPAMPPDAAGPKVVFGPGTGLGVAGLVPASGGWQVVPTEGGHVAFGPAADDEEPVFARLRAEIGFVSAEGVLSGPGLERLHRAVHPGGESLGAPAIIAQAHGGEGPARETVRLFVRLLGRFAGDLALLFRATGGVYVGGGVARRIGPLLDAPAFREAFERHPPYQDLLRRTPTTLITFDEPGLIGCITLAERMQAQ